MFLHHTAVGCLLAVALGAVLVYVGYMGYTDKPIVDKRFYIAFMVGGGLAIAYHLFCAIAVIKRLLGMKEKFNVVDMSEEAVVGLEGVPL